MPHLAKIEDFPDSIHVIGCQRSGTTMLAGIIAGSNGITQFDYGRHHELDSALILCGLQPHDAQGRHCFQTTFVNSAYLEYFSHAPNFKMIWVLRNPLSVVFSLLHNWSPWYTDMLFRECGAEQLKGIKRISYTAFTSLSQLQSLYVGYNGKGNRFLGKDRIPDEYVFYRDYEGTWEYCPIPRLERACLIYNSRLSQLFPLFQHLGSKRLLVVDYDELVRAKHHLLAKIYAFLGLQFRPHYADRIRGTSIGKSAGLTASERNTIEAISASQYERARSLCMSRS